MRAKAAVSKFYAGIGRTLPPRWHPTHFAQLCVFGLLVAASTFSLRANSPAAGFSFGISTHLFTDVNETDARAALKVWLKHMSDDRGIAGDPVINVLTSPAEFIGAFQSGLIEGATLPTVDLWHVQKSVPIWPTIIVGRLGSSLYQEYLLIVHHDSAVRGIADLQGRQLLVVGSTRGSLAEVWIEVELLKSGLGPADAFWSKVVPAGKLTRVAYPVFFKQADACIVTAEGYLTLCELNPQIGRQLKIIARSPPLVAAPFCFSAAASTGYRERVLSNIPYLNTVTGGRQALALFQTSELVTRPIGDLDETFRLIEEHQQLRAATLPSPTKEAR